MSCQHQSSSSRKKSLFFIQQAQFEIAFQKNWESNNNNWKLSFSHFTSSATFSPHSYTHTKILLLGLGYDHRFKLKILFFLILLKFKLNSHLCALHGCNNCQYLLKYSLRSDKNTRLRLRDFIRDGYVYIQNKIHERSDTKSQKNDDGD